MVPAFLYSHLFWLSSRRISLLDGHLVSVPKVAVLKEKFLLCFTSFASFSGHRPAQRECVQMVLRSHARCHPHPIPQPIKVDHTTGIYDPYSFRIVMWVLLHPTKNKSVKLLWDRTYGFSSLSEKTRKSNHLQISLQRQHFLPSYLKTLSVGPAGVWTRDLLLGRLGVWKFMKLPTFKKHLPP